MTELRAIATNGGSYVSESNYFQERWQQSYWGSNHARLAEIKKKYDPTGLFLYTTAWAHKSGAGTVLQDSSLPSHVRLASDTAYLS